MFSYRDNPRAHKTNLFPGPDWTAKTTAFSSFIKPKPQFGRLNMSTNLVPRKQVEEPSDSERIDVDESRSEDEPRFCDHCGDELPGPVFCSKKCQNEYLAAQEPDSTYIPSGDEETEDGEEDTHMSEEDELIDEDEDE